MIDRLDKHTRALDFQLTTAANVADLVDAICETDSRHVQEKQAAEASTRAERLWDLKDLSDSEFGAWMHTQIESTRATLPPAGEMK